MDFIAKASIGKVWEVSLGMVSEKRLGGDFVWCFQGHFWQLLARHWVVFGVPSVVYWLTFSFCVKNINGGTAAEIDAEGMMNNAKHFYFDPKPKKR